MHASIPCSVSCAPRNSLASPSRARVSLAALSQCKSQFHVERAYKQYQIITPHRYSIPRMISHVQVASGHARAAVATRLWPHASFDTSSRNSHTQTIIALSTPCMCRHACSYMCAPLEAVWASTCPWRPVTHTYAHTYIHKRIYTYSEAGDTHSISSHPDCCAAAAEGSSWVARWRCSLGFRLWLPVFSVYGPHALAISSHVDVGSSTEK